MGLLIRTSQLNTELAEINVGVIYLDLLFELHVRDFHAWINLEIQRNKPDDLIYTRMEFYASRLISSQKPRIHGNRLSSDYGCLLYMAFAL